MLVDFTAPDRALVVASVSAIKKALQRAATSARAVGHADSAYALDLTQLERFERRYKGAGGGDDAPTSFTGSLDVPSVECVVLRQGVLIVLDRYQGTQHDLQETLELNDVNLGNRLSDLRDLGTRLGGQASLFASAAASAEKASMAAEMGMPAASVGVTSSRKRVTTPKTASDTTKQWSRTHTPRAKSRAVPKTKPAKAATKPRKARPIESSDDAPAPTTEN